MLNSNISNIYYNYIQFFLFLTPEEILGKSEIVPAYLVYNVRYSIKLGYLRAHIHFNVCQRRERSECI